jgi:hypothetical protein
MKKERIFNKYVTKKLPASPKYLRILHRLECEEKKMLKMGTFSFKPLYATPGIVMDFETISQFAAFTFGAGYEGVFVGNDTEWIPKSRRSLTNNFRVARHYFPNIRLIEVLKEMWNNIHDHKDDWCRQFYCFDARRRVYFCKHLGSRWEYQWDKQEKIRDEFGLRIKDYVHLKKIL